MITTEDLRRLALALPEVEESSHFRWHVPVFKVRGRTFLGLGKDETTAVFCIAEQDADDAATTSPSTYVAVHRQDARKSFLGLEAALADLSLERAEALTQAAWRHQSPKSLRTQ